MKKNRVFASILWLTLIAWVCPEVQAQLRRDDSIGSMTLAMEFKGRPIAPFRLVEPLMAETEVIEYQDGDDLQLRKRPGRTRVHPLVVGVPRLPARHPLLLAWLDVREGQQRRDPVQLTWKDNAGNAVQSVSLFEAWVSALSVQPNGEWFITLQYEGMSIN